MSESAIVNHGGKQYRVSPGDELLVERTEPDLKAVVEYDVPTYKVEGVPDLVRLLKEHKRNILHSHF